MGRHRHALASGAQSALQTAAPPLLLVAFVVLRYHAITSLFWMIDDTQILKFAITHQPWEYFSRPEVWKQLSAGNFTPMLPLSFLMDWKLFGFNPEGFYMHQLATLCLLSVAGYMFLRLWLSELPSFLGVLLFIASPPFAEAAQFLMVRHYLEGLFFALLGSYCFIQALREDRAVAAIAGAVFYLFAILYKEIYLMFVFLILLLPWKTLTLWRRFLYALPWIGITCFYFFWRRFMLGHLSGGYGFEPRWSHDILLFIPNIFSAMGGDLGGLQPWWQLLIGLSSLLALGMLLKADRKTVFYLPVLSACVLLPIFPVSSVMSPRFVLLPLFALIAAHAFIWDRLTKSRPDRLFSPIVAAWAALFLSVFLSISLFRPFVKKETLSRYGVEGTFVLHKGHAGDLLIDPVAITQGHYYAGLSWFRKEILKLGEAPGISGDINVVCSYILLPEKSAIRSRFKRVWHFDSGSGSMLNEDINTYCTKENQKASIVTAPLSLRLQYKDSVIRWELGPYQSGTFTILFGETATDMIDLPPRGNRLIFLKNRTSVLRLRYASPEGWLTYSPLLTLTVDEKDAGFLEWSR